jgi:dTDP-4-dehydrorhamnose 3,5-epimerase
VKIEIIETEFKNLKIIIPNIYTDNRGYFFESYNKICLNEYSLNFDFIQDNQSKSEYGTIRGLHFQAFPYQQTKLIRVLQGEILDVVVDLRSSCNTFGKVFSIVLSDSNRKQLLVPAGFAHGFAVLSISATVLYKVDNIYNPNAERGIIYDDPLLNINWQIPFSERILSEKDKKNELFNPNEIYFN